MNWNQILEDAIIGKLVMSLIDEGYQVTVEVADDGNTWVYAMPDNGDINLDGDFYKHWVRLVPGNGVDVIVDYSINLEADLKEVLDFADTFRKGER